jgi:SIR2-like domain
MAKYLLTGAGFSRNWGGWLASEAFEYLIGVSGLPSHIRGTLWKHKEAGTGFEGAYQELRSLAEGSSEDDKHFQFFSRMVSGMFTSMQQSFPRDPFSEPILRFLAQFDAIFTLNQDTLLELKYCNQLMNDTVRQMSEGHFLGTDVPGIKSDREFNRSSPWLFLEDKYYLTTKDKHQPYFKLHGSSNWYLRKPGQTHLLILGGSKKADIEKSELLNWYYQNFQDAMSMPFSRIMIVGYSFGDEHINRCLLKGAASGARFFIVDPQGVDVIDKRGNDTWKRQSPEMLMSSLQESIDGASRRNLVDTIETDGVERMKITRFLNEWPY